MKTTTAKQLSELLFHLDNLCRGGRQKKEVHDYVRECFIIQFNNGRVAGRKEAGTDISNAYENGIRDGVQKSIQSLESLIK